MLHYPDSLGHIIFSKGCFVHIQVAGLRHSDDQDDQQCPQSSPLHSCPHSTRAWRVPSTDQPYNICCPCAAQTAYACRANPGHSGCISSGCQLPHMGRPSCAAHGQYSQLIPRHPGASPDPHQPLHRVSACLCISLPRGCQTNVAILSLLMTKNSRRTASSSGSSLKPHYWPLLGMRHWAGKTFAKFCSFLPYKH